MSAAAGTAIAGAAKTDIPKALEVVNTPPSENKKAGYDFGTISNNPEEDGDSTNIPQGGSVSSLELSYGVDGQSLEFSTSAILYGNDTSSTPRTKNRARNVAKLPALTTTSPSARASGDFFDESAPSNDNRRCSSCLPPWISEASPFIKSVILISLALMIASLILVVVAAILSIRQRGGEEAETNFVTVDSDNLGNGNRGGLGDVFLSTLTPTTTPTSKLLPEPEGENAKATEDGSEFSVEENTLSQPSPAPSFKTSSPTPPSSPEPTTQPTTQPTPNPTTLPTPNPTTYPTMGPTVAIAIGAIQHPTNFPAVGPTIQPTSQPTVQLTTLPTTEPIAGSTNAPTSVPSIVPTSLPTNVPTGVPTGVPTDAPTEVTTARPTPEPTTHQPTHAPSSKSPTLSPSTAPSPGPTEAPTSSPTLHPSSRPSNIPSLLPSSSIDMISSFYVIAGRFGGPSRQNLKDFLSELPSNNGTSFLIHLGDSSAVTCTLQNYINIRRSFDTTHSPSVPVIFLPGEADYVECPNPELAWFFWFQTFRESEKDWTNKPYNVLRQTDVNRDENFAFILESILHVGLNMIGTEVFGASGTDRSESLQQNLDWVQENVEQNLATIEAVVLYANYGVGEDDNDDQDEELFFGPIRRNIGCDGSTVSPWSGLRVVYVNDLDASDGVVESNGRNGNCLNFISVNVESGIWPPLKVDVFSGGSGPSISFSFDQNEWYDQITS